MKTFKQFINEKIKQPLYGYNTANSPKLMFRVVNPAKPVPLKYKSLKQSKNNIIADNPCI
jgi:hypothetical protein